ncbi:hypothetical protein GUJ93_ZPchr0013g35086 [Zizania palustris]|uniref:Protein kinase domain-containing protein n=1 Tax=Zizania palustris TaxID=103762 RepID=A0A8J6C2W9_ZIZPA|nr:hypothetical protein GUJ93_ZPchr0013g35086 [Zizania palustris]
MKKKSTTLSWSVLPARSAVAEPWAVDRLKPMIGKRFATGSDSRVYRGIYGQQAVAVKMIRAPEGGDDDKRRALEEQFNAEVTLLWRLRHPNVVQLVAAYREPPVYCVITEYMSRGTLRGVVHRDLKSLNLLLDDGVRAKVADLGTSCLESPRRAC